MEKILQDFYKIIIFGGRSEIKFQFNPHYRDFLDNVPLNYTIHFHRILHNFRQQFVPILVHLGRLLFQNPNKLKKPARDEQFSETIFGLTERLICNRISTIN
jgi:hypothetical protein